MNLIKRGHRWLVISDLQIPFERDDAIKRVKEIAKEEMIIPENILCVGDEFDQYWGGLWPKSPDAKFTQNQEIEIGKEKIKQWYSAFPKMKIALSNHGERWRKRFIHAEIPSQLMRQWREIIEAPEGWQWQKTWQIDAKHPFRMIHGMGYSGAFAHRVAAIEGGISTVIGHLHAHPGVNYVKLSGASWRTKSIWGMNVGCMIDTGETSAFAFEYSENDRYRAQNALGLIADDGAMALVIPQ